MNREDIETILGPSQQTSVFIDKLEEWIAQVNHPASFFRKPQISRPRSAAAVQAIEAAKTAAVKFSEKNQAILNLPAYRWPRELSEINKMSDDIRNYDSFLSKLVESMRPTGPSGKSKRLYTERYALRGLMWLYSRHLPHELISNAPDSRFSRIADYMLKNIGYVRSDLRELIKQEMEVHLWFRSLNPISDDDVMSIYMEP